MDSVHVYLAVSPDPVVPQLDRAIVETLPDKTDGIFENSRT